MYTNTHTYLKLTRTIPKIDYILYTGPQNSSKQIEIIQNMLYNHNLGKCLVLKTKISK